MPILTRHIYVHAGCDAGRDLPAHFYRLAVAKGRRQRGSLLPCRISARRHDQCQRQSLQPESIAAGQRQSNLKVTGQTGFSGNNEYFTITGIPSGKQQLIVNGREANLGVFAILAVSVNCLTGFSTILDSTYHFSPMLQMF